MVKQASHERARIATGPRVALAAPSAFARSTFTTCAIAFGGAGVTGCTTLTFLRID